MSDRSLRLEARRCLALRIAIVLGIILCLYNGAYRFWPGLGVGVAGTLVAAFMARRVCGEVRAKTRERQHTS